MRSILNELRDQAKALQPKNVAVIVASVLSIKQPGQETWLFCVAFRTQV